MLIFAAAEVEHLASAAGAGKTGASIIGGMGGGIAQAVHIHFIPFKDQLTDEMIKVRHNGLLHVHEDR